ncbi:MAG TPA: adenylyltransferase/cytidyltransferase family protein [Candidatus Saccharimonadales bacterium]|nr:adenylyltransferase/cytidyltransferase family protein [Candidatus Saccharimonadales bacterium]
MNIGIFPGTFDPIHPGHISFALKAAQMHSLDVVHLIPEAIPRGKPHATPLAERIERIEAAIEQHPQLSVLISPFPTSSTNQTLPWLTAQFSESTLTLLLGSDVAAHLGAWDSLPSLAQTVSFIIGMRSGDSRDALHHSIQQAQKKHSILINHSFLTASHAHLASSVIRATQ